MQEKTKKTALWLAIIGCCISIQLLCIIIFFSLHLKEIKSQHQKEYCQQQQITKQLEEINKKLEAFAPKTAIENNNIQENEKLN